ncbi:MAG TPA: hypothetical protein VJQ84_06960 [Solirubrobacterales bacterium]|nr:hypothetical protein [Solirubrobacterales bacterium]
MAAVERDSTEDWLLPEQTRPPLIGELQQRVDQALATARASEAAVMSVGAAAIDAAEQARRAAEQAERASAIALDAQERVALISVAPDTGTSATSPTEASSADADSGLSDFTTRADRLVARLQQLQRVPLPEPSTSETSSRPQSAS